MWLKVQLSQTFHSSDPLRRASIMTEVSPLLKGHFTWKACTLLCKSCRSPLPQSVQECFNEHNNTNATLNAHLPTATLKPSISYKRSLCVCVRGRSPCWCETPRPNTGFSFKEIQQVSAHRQPPASHENKPVQLQDEKIPFITTNNPIIGYQGFLLLSVTPWRCIICSTWQDSIFCFATHWTQEIETTVASPWNCINNTAF